MSETLQRLRLALSWRFGATWYPSFVGRPTSLGVFPVPQSLWSLEYESLKFEGESKSSGDLCCRDLAGHEEEVEDLDNFSACTCSLITVATNIADSAAGSLHHSLTLEAEGPKRSWPPKGISKSLSWSHCDKKSAGKGRNWCRPRRWRWVKNWVAIMVELCAINWDSREKVPSFWSKLITCRGSSPKPPTWRTALRTSLIMGELYEYEVSKRGPHRVGDRDAEWVAFAV